MPSAAARLPSAENASVPNTIPALASAKMGRMTNDDHGCSACTVRLRGDTAWRDSSARCIHDSLSASGRWGSSEVSSATRWASADTAAGRCSATAGISRPTATPAMVACTPDAAVKAQVRMPSAM